MSEETDWPRWHAPARDDLPTMLGYPRTIERVSLETWMNIYCKLLPEQRTKVVLKNGLTLSRKWLATLPRPR